MKILIVGDIHIDANLEQDTNEALEKIIKYSHEYECNKVILLGDIYHRRDVQKGSKEEDRFHRFLSSFPETTSIHILTGNHDLSDDRNLLSEIPYYHRVFLYDKITTPFYIGDKLAVMLPWENHRRTDSVAWFQEKCEYLKTLTEKFILFAHVPFIEAKFNNNKMISNQSKNFPSIKLLEAIPNFSFAFLGDIHLPQDIGDRALYVGGIRNSNFSEAGDKRVILLDSDTGVGIDLWLGCRDTYVSDVKLADLQTMLSYPFITNKIVKLKVACTQEEYEKGFGVITHSAHLLKIEYEIQGKKEFKSLDITDDERMFELYCDTLSGKYGNDIINNIKTIGVDIIRG